MKKSGIIVVSLFSVLLAGCIKDDIPYPRIQQNIREISVEGELKRSSIDSTNCEATVYLEETVDIENVKFTQYVTTPGSESSLDLLSGTYNLTNPLTVTLTGYQDYTWTIRAEQTIERYFAVEGEIGESVVDPIGHRVIISVPEGTDLSTLTLERIKLGPEGITTLVPDIQPGTIDLTYPKRVEVICHGRSTYWTIYSTYTDLIVSTSSVDAWSQVIWAYGSGPSDVTNGFQYKESGSTDWIEVPASNVTQTQGAFSCYISHLKPLTEYVVRAVSGENYGNEIKVSTQSTADIPDGDFENWNYSGKIWYPYAEGGTQFWDTGNTGTSTLGQNNVYPTDHTATGSGQAAMLDTRFVGLAGIGKLAAGSIFTGSFSKVDGMNGILDFGRPWTLRPTKLKGYYQYQTAPIDYASTEFKSLIGQPDTCHIYVALADWTAPYEIRTNPKNRQLFDKSSSSVIAYGELLYSGTMSSYKEFEIKLDYRDTSRVPTYLLITSATSKYGDYFTGGTGAVLYVDQFSFDWDLP